MEEKELKVALEHDQARKTVEPLYPAHGTSPFQHTASVHRPQLELDTLMLPAGIKQAMFIPIFNGIETIYECQLYLNGEAIVKGIGGTKGEAMENARIALSTQAALSSQPGEKYEAEGGRSAEGAAAAAEELSQNGA